MVTEVWWARLAQDVNCLGILLKVYRTMSSSLADLDPSALCVLSCGALNLRIVNGAGASACSLDYWNSTYSLV